MTKHIIIGALIGFAVARFVRPSREWCCGKVKEGLGDKLDDRLGDGLGGAIVGGADKLGLLDPALGLSDVVGL
jgi:hypothetical protein